MFTANTSSVIISNYFLTICLSKFTSIEVFKMKKRIITILSCLMFLLILVVLIESVIHNYRDEPVESDVIILLGGGDAGRIEKAAELYREGYAPYVLITPVIEDDRLSQSTALANELGIPEEALILDDEATSTYMNAVVSMNIMEEYDFNSALIVTSDYHIKRAKYIFEKEKNDGFHFRYIPAYSVNNEKWYERDYAFRLWRGEFIKMWGYRFSMYHLVDFTDEGERIQEEQ